MKNKFAPIILTVVLALVIGGAYVLYDRLGSTATPEQLATLQTQPTDASTQPTAPAPTETLPPETSSPATEASLPTETTQAAAPIAPDFTVYDLEGNPVRLSDFFGKPVVLNFWASWCGPCQMEMPDFHETFLELGDEIQFLFINMTDGSRETVAIASAFIADKGYTFPVYYDTQFEAAYTYGVYSLPTTYFINARGEAIAQASGAIDAATLLRGIDMIR